MSKTVIYGIHAVESALRNDPDNVGRIWVDRQVRNNRLRGLLALLETSGLATIPTDTEQLSKYANTHRHQGVVAEYTRAKSYTEHDLYELLEHLDEPAFLLVLDGVTDPHNLGACLRSCDGAGVHAVIVPRDNATGITPTARKVASGAAETVPLITVTNLARTLDQLKERGIWLTGTSDTAEQTLFQANLKGPMALVMGAEDKGVRRLTEERCDFLVSIPMQGQVSSLNVSVATGICLFEAMRQRMYQ